MYKIKAIRIRIVLRALTIDINIKDVRLNNKINNILSSLKTKDETNKYFIRLVSKYSADSYCLDFIYFSVILYYLFLCGIIMKLIYEIFVLNNI